MTSSALDSVMHATLRPPCNEEQALQGNCSFSPTASVSAASASGGEAEATMVKATTWSIFSSNASGPELTKNKKKIIVRKSADRNSAFVMNASSAEHNESVVGEPSSRASRRDESVAVTPKGRKLK